MTRRISVLVLLLCSLWEVCAGHEDLEALFVRLDSVLANSERYVLEKEDRIEKLHKRQESPLKPEERLWLNTMLYDEYYVYNADSAMGYVNRNIDLAVKLGRKDKKQEWMLNKVFLLTAQGLLTEAEKEL